MTAIQMHQVAEPYIRRRAIRHLEKGAPSSSRREPPIPTSRRTRPLHLRGLEIHAEIIAKATSVDGVYDKDPRSTGTP
jgi:uridylate kinase